MFLLLRLFCLRLLCGSGADWDLAAEVLALRQQLALLVRQVPRVRARTSDRLFLAVLVSLWPDWRRALLVVRPETVIRWHRLGFRLLWRFKSRPHGRPPIDAPLRSLPCTDARSNRYCTPRSVW